MATQDITTNVTKWIDDLNIVKSKIDGLLYSDVSLVDNLEYLKDLVAEYKILLDFIIDFKNKNE